MAVGLAGGLARGLARSLAVGLAGGSVRGLVRGLAIGLAGRLVYSAQRNPFVPQGTLWTDIALTLAFEPGPSPLPQPSNPAAAAVAAEIWCECFDRGPVKRLAREGLRLLCQYLGPSQAIEHRALYL